MESDDELAVVPLKVDDAAGKIQRVFRGASSRSKLAADPVLTVKKTAAEEAAATRKARLAIVKDMEKTLERLSGQQTVLVKSHEVHDMLL